MKLENHLPTLLAPVGRGRSLERGGNECPREIIIRWLHCAAAADIWGWGVSKRKGRAGPVIADAEAVAALRGRLNGFCSKVL